MIREHIIEKLVENKDVLDIGSIGQTEAYSLWNQLSKTNCKSLTGIDLPNIVDSTTRTFKLETENLPDDERIHWGNMETYKFNQTFDVIIAGDVIEHVANQELFLRNIHNHLSDKGIFVLTTPNAKWPTVFLKPNPTHTLWHDKFTLERILTVSGFRITKLIYYPGNKPNYNIIQKLLAWQQSMLVICEKIQ